MFRIGEFSKLTQVSIRMLRYYDEVGLLKPAAIDSINNYRLYATEQIPMLNQIIFLRDLGFNVKEISTAVKKWQPENIAKLLDQKQLMLEKQLSLGQKRLTKLAIAKQDLVKEKIELHSNITIKSVPSYQVLSLRKIVKDYFQEGLLWKELAMFVEEQKISLSSGEESLTIYHDPEYKNQDVDMETCLVTDQLIACPAPFSCHQIKAVPLMASSMVYGSFEKMNDLYLAFAGWLTEHQQYQMGNHSRQIVHRGPWNEENPDNYLIEIQIPIQEKSSN
ncbi:MerR family transcriptional regulator [Enterococcus sp. ALS3]|uniref:MerR family transcriptional regulator n=1 Tax=Enterococcus alishanensis TaxID=1303817 RepID=A0ABS6TGC2_9ENTE|nr:MerR family transcriptional regulator [Enterococcus alishanensis]MBV7391897.1 MerR family transcriptional regulator [Enterococcus alishanensis]